MGLTHLYTMLSIPITPRLGRLTLESYGKSGDLMVCTLTPDQASRVYALTGVTGLSFWARHFTLTVHLSTQEYKWAPVNCGAT